MTIQTRELALRAVQQRLIDRRKGKPGSVVEELLAERKQEAEKEQLES